MDDDARDIDERWDRALDAVLADLVRRDPQAGFRQRVMRRLSGHPPRLRARGARWTLVLRWPVLVPAAMLLVAIVLVPLLWNGGAPSVQAPSVQDRANPGASVSPRTGASPPATPGSADAGGRATPRPPGGDVLAGGVNLGPVPALPRTTMAAVRSRVTALGALEAGPAGQVEAADEAIAPLAVDPIAPPVPIEIPFVEVSPIVLDELTITPIELEPVEIGSRPAGDSQKRQEEHR